MGAAADFVIEYRTMDLGSNQFGADPAPGSPTPPPSSGSGAPSSPSAPVAGTSVLKWVYKVKKNAAGEAIKHKARLVAKGYVQQPGVDFDEVFAPVAHIESVWLLLALAAQEGWPVHHMDVKSAFLNGELVEEVYFLHPPGFTVVGHENKVLRLDKALYGLRQAPRAWNAKLDETLVALGFSHSMSEHAVYARGKGASRLLPEALDARGLQICRHGSVMSDIREWRSPIAGQEEDILSRFLLERERDPGCFDNKYLRDIILNFVIAGRDTTAGTLSWFLYALCKNQSDQNKIAREVRDATTGDGDVGVQDFTAVLTEDAINKMHYLHAVLTEALRLYPAVPIDVKYCFSDDTLPDGHAVNKGDMVNYQPYPMGRMKFLWGDDADEFRPERWLDVSTTMACSSPRAPSSSRRSR
ncbi:hypothetical protein E2562_009896 [Oryza meyeriana var. granulata]|uniref:Reverse transcriptase Ty1/copia-type domain-containing protein n=1 Tax=Oryza meyeriana var. granulata TaxID=110450 RepID=A0A6G1BVR9_9ORYZ|nr:hypothetical protein E2562_009896 [Oryza meyeriana var. granulata]